jgi:UTP--glucose-1-phosphate uridylyltransferase
MNGVVPAAGLGTRLLPATVAVAKELLPLGRHPAICATLLEACAAGLERLVVVGASDKEDLRRLLEPARWNPGLRGPAVEKLRALLARIEVRWVLQPKPVGVLDAIERGMALAGEPCAVLFPDLVHLPSQDALGSLVRAHEECGETVFGIYDASRATAPMGPTARVVLDGNAAPEPGRARRIVGVEAPRTTVEPEEWRTTFAAIHTAALTAALDADGRRDDSTLDDARLVEVLDRLARAGRLYGAALPGEVIDIGSAAGYLDGARRFATGEARFVELE